MLAVSLWFVVVPRKWMICQTRTLSSACGQQRGSWTHRWTRRCVAACSLLQYRPALWYPVAKHASPAPSPQSPRRLRQRTAVHSDTSSSPAEPGTPTAPPTPAVETERSSKRRRTDGGRSQSTGGHMYEAVRSGRSAVVVRTS